MTDADLQDRLAYWQQRLRLQHWHITAEFVRQRTFDNDDTQGECRQVLTKNKARILILDPVDRGLYGDYRDDGNDIETTLVHELLHCLPAFDTERIQKHRAQRRVELTIHPLSIALVEENRREGK